jgi:hypothetical protein
VTAAFRPLAYERIADEIIGTGKGKGIYLLFFTRRLYIILWRKNQRIHLEA